MTNKKSTDEPTDHEASIPLNNFPLADKCHTCTRTRDYCYQNGEIYPDCYREEPIISSTSIDKLIVEREENSDFDEMTAQMAEKIIENIDPDADDAEASGYEDIKDIIRDHLVDWFERCDTSTVEVE